MEQIKNHISLIMTIVALVTAMFTFDSRYAHAEDTKLAVVNISQKLDTHTRSMEDAVQKASNNLRKQILEDKVFEIETKQAQRTATPVDVALKARYLRQLEDVSK